MSEPFTIRMPPDIQSVQIGDHQVLLIDDFLEDPQALLEAACSTQFELCPGVMQGKGYPGMRSPAPLEYSVSLTELLDPLIKANFGVSEDLPIRKIPCTFSLTTVPPSELGPLQRKPHFDASRPNHFAVLLYLCGEEHGGTGFYRHKVTGLQQITREVMEPYSKVFVDEVERRPPPARYFDDSDEHFTFLGMVPARFNRLIVYSGGLLHTACVNPALSISSDPRKGRLTVNTFYDF